VTQPHTAADSASRSAAQPELSIVVPALNEEECVERLVDEVKKEVLDAGIDGELVVVDDGSGDQTLARLRALAVRYRWLKVLHRPQPQGQSAAMYAGIHASRGRYVAMLDADLQNDPSELLGMLQLLRGGEADLVQGDRSANRRDPFIRRCSSVVGRQTRKWLLGDSIRDTGCSLRMMRVEIARQLPLAYKGMHRFIPFYARMLGAKVVEVPVKHRPRQAGTAKYGVWNRALSGLMDCLAVRWMRKRYRDTSARPVEGGEG
jgi:glycosyltransferase involved in cell wall biosynthesis